MALAGPRFRCHKPYESLLQLTRLLGRTVAVIAPGVAPPEGKSENN